jgi:hypothetical protein
MRAVSTSPAPLALLMLALAALLAGCATPGGERGENELPWNAPQSWEGQIGIPGFEPR